jgi:phosphoribosylaminoimidazole-succinocarboxamide synthase
MPSTTSTSATAATPPDPATAAADSATALPDATLSSLPLLHRGKVRDNYAVGDELMLMVASDRISAFDVVMREPIPGKGRILTAMAQFWFDRLAGTVPDHRTGIAPASVVEPHEAPLVEGRAMVVKRLRPLPVEAVVRGYLAGSGWKEYQATQAVCGVPLPPGLQLASRLPQPIFTPATKAALGEHDENIDFARMADIVGGELAERIRAVSIELYARAAAYAAARGILIADTKFEFGLDAAGTLTLMDEVLTPDSSRYWPADGWQPGRNPPSFDKQFLRDWLEGPDCAGWNKQPPPPALPQAVIDGTLAKYREAYERLTAV